MLTHYPSQNNRPTEQHDHKTSNAVLLRLSRGSDEVWTARFYLCVLFPTPTPLNY